ncbi:MAG: carboxylating nicotinate-nucleotide diphosphorylase [Candidatus Sumerlaeaceae bacterium]
MTTQIVCAALAEDIGPGDVSAAIFSDSEAGKAHFLAKQNGILSGNAIVNEVFSQLSPAAKVRWRIRDGEAFTKGMVLGEVSGPFAILLQGERVSLNFLQRMSGIATLTNQFVQALGPAGNIGIYDTRKTTPLLREFEKQAVVHGGGQNHRFGLYDMAMLKNNHIDAAGGVASAVARLHENGFFDPRSRRHLCIEARDLAEALDALSNRADIVMLDNMPPRKIREVVAKIETRARQLRRPMPQIEVSGGITLKNIRNYSRLPIDRISVGAITHSAPSLDIALHFDSE